MDNTASGIGCFASNKLLFIDSLDITHIMGGKTTEMALID